MEVIKEQQHRRQTSQLLCPVSQENSPFHVEFLTNSSRTLTRGNRDTCFPAINSLDYKIVGSVAYPGRKFRVLESKCIKPTFNFRDTGCCDINPLAWSSFRQKGLITKLKINRDKSISEWKCKYTQVFEYICEHILWIYYACYTIHLDISLALLRDLTNTIIAQVWYKSHCKFATATFYEFFTF